MMSRLRPFSARNFSTSCLSRQPTNCSFPSSARFHLKKDQLAARKNKKSIMLHGCTRNSRQEAPMSTTTKDIRFSSPQHNQGFRSLGSITVTKRRPKYWPVNHLAPAIHWVDFSKFSNCLHDVIITLKNEVHEERYA